MYTALYRAYRPETFDTVLGQEHIVKILKNQIAGDTTGHAYLFCGTRGTGKTTTARLLAKGVNCTSENIRPCGVCDNCKAIKDGTFMDVVEIDAASNNGVDNIRELKESVKYPPVVGRKKVYIIDEVHMLSSGAFNALLKTLEEPPENVMFILATTEPQKLPATILSRCLRLDFRRVPETVLKSGMKSICQTMGIQIDDGALALVAANADGSVRDGLSILDQCLSAGSKDISREDVLEILGTVGEETFLEMTDAVTRHNVGEALLLLDRVLADGKDVRQFMKDWVTHYRNLLITKFVNRAEDLLNMSCENIERICGQSQRLDVAEINNGIIELSKTLAEAKWSTQPRVLLELCIVKMATGMLQKTTYAPQAPAGQPSLQPIANSGIPAGSGGQQTSSYAPGLVAQAEFNQSADKGGPSGSGALGAAAPASSSLQPGEREISAASGETADNSPELQVDKDALWHSVFEEGETSSASFNLIRTGTALAEVNSRYFVVLASSSTIENYVEKKKQVLEESMAEHTGVRRELICKVKGQDDGKGDGMDIQRIKQNAENALGISIELI
ncbi:DNA polymerase III subunit gamma/tau [Aminipila butyrica]|uniref:DNA-directed DNA polymerase n=1 Tax=Aminipila butyrica TaxID=433296 RepID=A0A858C173_9FIRM|nr:DNA polymerase III subunit gamma/tau [Aminipila butyrica]QIB70206.1 DNA polymerase III subunit gamma/tau [Aminipila butyrica]